MPLFIAYLVMFVLYVVTIIALVVSIRIGKDVIRYHTLEDQFNEDIDIALDIVK